MKKSILEVVYESVEGLYDAGLVDAIIMHEFNAMRLMPIENLSPQVKGIRISEDNIKEKCDNRS